MSQNNTGFPEHLGLSDNFRYRRFLKSCHLPRRDPGRCKWCDAVVPKGRSRWCSAECVDAFKLRAWNTAVCAQVERRDRGVCSICGIDTSEIAALYGRMRRMATSQYSGPVGMREWFAYRDGVVEAMFKAWGPWHRFGFRRRLWDADHIIPVIQGGGCCGLENYRTLCVRCHKQETGALAGRRAADKSLAK